MFVCRNFNTVVTVSMYACLKKDGKYRVMFDLKYIWNEDTSGNVHRYATGRFE